MQPAKKQKTSLGAMGQIDLQKVMCQSVGEVHWDAMG